MNRIQFGEGGCEKTRKHLDAYISNELMVETNYEVLRHIEGCPACAAEVDTRTRLRSRLKAAVNAQSVPPELQVRVRQQIHGNRSGSWIDLRWLRAGGLRWAGAVSDPVDAWLRCGPSAPTHVLVGGRPVVRGGELLQPDLDDLLRRHAAAARRLQGC